MKTIQNEDYYGCDDNSYLTDEEIATYMDERLSSVNSAAAEVFNEAISCELLAYSLKKIDDQYFKGGAECENEADAMLPWFLREQAL